SWTGRGKEVSIPGVPTVTRGCQHAAHEAGRAGLLAVEVVPHMDDQVRPPSGCAGRHLGEGPLTGIVAGLALRAFLPATGITYYQDPLGGCLGQRQRFSVDRSGRRARRNGGLATQHRIGWEAGPGAHLHSLRLRTERDRGATAFTGDGAR